MLKWIFKASFALAIILVCVVILLQKDDVLNVKLEELITTTSRHDDSKAYYYLLGFRASKQGNPIEIGELVFTNIKYQELANAETPSINNRIVYHPVEDLPRPESPLLCQYRDESCLPTIFDNIDKIPALISQHRLYISRFKEYAALNDFHTLSEPSIAEPLPNYASIKDAVRLATLEQIYLASTGRSVQAIKNLFRLHEQLRAQLVQQDNIIGKLFLQNLISESIDIIYIVNANNHFPVKKYINPLNAQERSLTEGFIREIQMSKILFESLDKSPNILNSLDENIYINSPPWLARLLFKPNMSINQTSKQAYYGAQLSSFNINEFSQEMFSRRLQPMPEEHWFRNPLGTMLAQIPSRDNAEFISNFWSINNKINLFNDGMKARRKNHNFKQVTSVFPSQQDEIPYFKDHKQKICLTSPFDDRKDLQCLRVNIRGIE